MPEVIDWTSCPEILEDGSRCLAPAEIFERFVLESTDEPVEHVRTRCVNRHILALPAEVLLADEREVA